MAKYRYVDMDEMSNDPFSDSETESNSEFLSLLDSEGAVASHKKYKVGEKVTGEVISVTADYVFVDVGGKITASLGREEITGAGELLPKPGDEISAFVIQDNGSELLLSRSVKRADADLDTIRNAFQSKLPIEAKVTKVNSGGFEALIGTRKCFVPMGHIDTNVKEPESYLGSVFAFHIIEFKGRNIVLSRKQILREELDRKKSEIFSRLEVGQNYRAQIVKLADFGAFASIDGVEGLIPLSELSWKRVKKADEVVKLDEFVQVKVKSIEMTPKFRLALSLKDAGEDPWISHATRLNPGSVFEGVVTNFIDAGAFVRIFDGVDAFVPVSQITWEKRIKHPRDALTLNQNVSVTVMVVDLEARKLSASIKGPMPEEMQLKIKSKMSGSEGLSPEDQALAKDWADYQASMKNKPQAEVGVFASAFSRAMSQKK